MNPGKTAASVLLLLSSMSPYPLLSDLSQDLLPLGSSAHRFAIGRIEAEQIIDCGTGQAVSIEAIAARAAESDLFVIGEIHDSFTCHRLQKDLIEALQKKHPKLVVGFEFFEREDDPTLRDWSRGQIDEQTIIDKTGWYGESSLNFGYTAMVLKAVQANGLSAIGLNLPRSLARKISRKGFASLSSEEKRLYPTIDAPNPDHEFFIRTIFGEMAVRIPAWFENIYAAQKAWDVIMAESMHKALSQRKFRKHKGVIIAGSNHVAYQLGIPFRYRLRDRKARLVTIVPIRIPSPQEKGDEAAHPMMKMLNASAAPSALFSRGIADYVFSVPAREQSPYPSLGLSVREEKGGLRITNVQKNSLADHHGIRTGDLIEAIDKVPMTSIQGFNAFMAGKSWNDETAIRLLKKIRISEEPPAVEKQ